MPSLHRVYRLSDMMDVSSYLAQQLNGDSYHQRASGVEVGTSAQNCKMYHGSLVPLTVFTSKIPLTDIHATADTLSPLINKEWLDAGFPRML